MTALFSLAGVPIVCNSISTTWLKQWQRFKAVAKLLFDSKHQKWLSSYLIIITTILTIALDSKCHLHWGQVKLYCYFTCGLSLKSVGNCQSHVFVSMYLPTHPWKGQSLNHVSGPVFMFYVPRSLPTLLFDDLRGIAQTRLQILSHSKQLQITVISHDFIRTIKSKWPSSPADGNKELVFLPVLHLLVNTAELSVLFFKHKQNPHLQATIYVPFLILVAITVTQRSGTDHICHSGQMTPIIIFL